MISAISVKDRIKNKAVSCSISVNDLLQAYGLERTVYRISVSEFSDRFTLKGGIFLYALFDGEFARATRKDFYDIYLIAENYELDGEILKDAVQETFAHRNTTFNDIFAFKSAFINSPIHNSRWEVFLNKKKATVKVELERVIVIIRDLLLPISESIISGKEFTSIWNNKDRAWQ